MDVSQEHRAVGRNQPGRRAAESRVIDESQVFRPAQSDGELRWPPTSSVASNVRMKMWPISSRVNSRDNNDEGLLEPIEPVHVKRGPHGPDPELPLE